MVEEIAPGLYRFRLFRTLAECDDVLRMIDAERAKHSGAPNTMNRYGVTLQEPGYALVHAGSLPHRALRITSGSRTNLVLWCRARGAQQFA